MSTTKEKISDSSLTYTTNGYSMDLAKARQIQHRNSAKLEKREKSIT